MAQQVNDNYYLNSNKPIDAKQTQITGVPFTSLAQARAAVPIAYRYKGLVQYIDDGTGLKEYWYKNGITNSDLILKTSGSSIVITGNSTQITGDGATTEFIISHEGSTVPKVVVVNNIYIDGVSTQKTIAVKPGSYTTTGFTVYAIGASLPLPDEYTMPVDWIAYF